MSPVKVFQHRFVDYIPADPEEGIVYISIPYATVVHLCPSGCGNKVVTPLTPTDWTLSFDGETVSLDPSVGNWNFACQSHYWITNNAVVSAPQWTKERIRVGRDMDLRRKAEYFGRLGGTDAPGTVSADKPLLDDTLPAEGVFSRLLKRLFR